MASTDISALIDFYVREKDLTRQRVIEALEDSFLTAYAKMVPGSGRIHNIRAVINTKNDSVKIKADMTVVADENLTDRFNEVPLSLAQLKGAKNGKTYEVGDTITLNITPLNFGRIAVQTARQTMQQRIRKAEQDMLADVFADRVGEVVSGTVRRYDKGNIIVEVEKFEAIVPQKYRIPGEEYNSGDNMRFYIVEVKNSDRGTELILSRSHPNLVRRLFESEVMEIADHTVEIVRIVREAGYRTKMIVRSADPNIDPIGACVGMRGARVKNVVNELNHEKIDILEYTDDKMTLVAESLSPIEAISIDMNKEKRVVTVVVEDDKAAAKAKGRKGQNVRLTARLISTPDEQWDVRVVAHDKQAATKQIAAEGAAALAQILEVRAELADSMIANGFTTVETIANFAAAEDLVDALGISEDEAASIINKAKAAC